MGGGGGVCFGLPAPCERCAGRTGRAERLGRGAGTLAAGGARPASNQRARRLNLFSCFGIGELRGDSFSLSLCADTHEADVSELLRFEGKVQFYASF